MTAEYSSSSTSNSRESTPIDYDGESTLRVASRQIMTEEEAQDSCFLKLPADIFRCVLDYLDGEAAWSLKRLCRGMARSKEVNKLLFSYPIQWNNVRDLRLPDWKYKSHGEQRWISFQSAINDSNRDYVQKLAMSHWCRIADFEWVEQNLPCLNSLELTAIKDFVWTPEETWTWKQLAEACPSLFARITELEVSNWSDYTLHSRIEYNYSYSNYMYKHQFRLSRRRDGGSVARMIFPLCTQLKTLAIRERYSGFHTWNEWEVHQRVCSFVDGITQYCPHTLTKLRIYDYAPYRSLFSTDITSWGNLKDVEIGLYSWMEDRRDRDVIGPIPLRITTGHHHRDEEEAFDDRTYDTCERNHMDLGQHVVQGESASFEDLLQNLRLVIRKHPHINVKPMEILRGIVLHPFHLIHVTQRRTINAPHLQQQQRAESTRPDPISNREIQESLRWLHERCGWRPILPWDSMLCDVFPSNLEPSRTFLPPAEVIARIQTMVGTLKSLSIPVRVSIGGDRTVGCSSDMDGSLFFGDYKMFTGEGDNKHEVLAPTQAHFNFSGIASLVDEFTIQYPANVPGVSASRKKPNEREKELLRKEMRGWRLFWKRYALLFKNLKKLTILVPTDIYTDWEKSDDFCQLFEREDWQMLETDDQHSLEYGVLSGYLPFSLGYRYHVTRRRPKMRFVQRVLFRNTTDELELEPGSMAAEDRETWKYSEQDIVARTDPDKKSRRFWPAKKGKIENSVHAEKRKAEDEGGEMRDAKRIRRAA